MMAFWGGGTMPVLDTTARIVPLDLVMAAVTNCLYSPFTHHKRMGIPF